MTKETSDRVSSIAGKYLKIEANELYVLSKDEREAIAADIRTLAASCLVQDETSRSMLGKPTLREIDRAIIAVAAKREPEGVSEAREGAKRYKGALSELAQGEPAPDWPEQEAQRFAKAREAITAPAKPKPIVYELSPFEIEIGLDRVTWAEMLIRQLPADHAGRNSWLINFAKG